MHGESLKRPLNDSVVATFATGGVSAALLFGLSEMFCIDTDAETFPYAGCPISPVSSHIRRDSPSQSLRGYTRLLCGGDCSVVRLVTDPCEGVGIM